MIMLMSKRSFVILEGLGKLVDPIMEVYFHTWKSSQRYTKLSTNNHPSCFHVYGMPPYPATSLKASQKTKKKKVPDDPLKPYFQTL